MQHETSKKAPLKKQPTRLSINNFVPQKSKSNLLKLKSQFGKAIHAKKIMKFVKSSAKSIPNFITKQQTKDLLPKLENIVFEDESDEIRMSNNIKFREVEGNLTNSMVMFRKKTQTQNNTDLWAVNLQTQKCYKTIPLIFFQSELNQSIFSKHIRLTKNQKAAQQTMYTLMDYLDQVEFNINQQVDAKIKIYMDFVFCMNCIQDLVNIDLQKINQARKKTRILRDITVSRAVRINSYRNKKQKIQEMKDLLDKMKRMKGLESKLNSQIMVGNYISHDPKNKIGAIYKEYCEIHNNELMRICCQGSNNLCKYWDVTYYVEKGFQEQVTKALAQYILEIITPKNDIEKFKRAFSINKKTFMSTPGSISKDLGSSSFIDESYEVDALDYVEIIIKQSNEKEITRIFMMGMQKYNFSTERVEKELKEKFMEYVDQYVEEVINEATSDCHISLKKILPINSQEGALSKRQFFETEDCKNGIKRLSWVKYQKFIQIFINRIESISQRIFSIINRILKSATELEQQQPQRLQVISSFMIQLVITIVSQISDKLCKIIGYRINFHSEQEMFTLFKSKTNSTKDYDLELENMKSMIKFLKKFQLSVEKLNKLYPFVKTQLDEVERREGEGLFQDIKQLKANLINIAYDSLHKSIISRELRQKLEEETWQSVQLPTDIYEELGYIIGGTYFVFEEEKKSRDMLSNSIFLQKTSPQAQFPKYNKQAYSSRFKVNNKYVTIDTFKFRLTRSTLQIIGFLKHYLQLYDETNSLDKKFELHGKITELILMYNQYLKQLILKSEALKYGKIKGKSITAKHYLICYIQLQAIDLIFCGRVLQERIQISSQQSQIMHQKVTITKNQIKSKFRKILEMRILDYIEDINIKLQDILESEQLRSIPKNFYNCTDLFADLMFEEAQYASFIDLQGKWIVELVNKVGKGSKGKLRKQRCLKYLHEHLMPLQGYLMSTLETIQNALK